MAPLRQPLLDPFHKYAASDRIAAVVCRNGIGKHPKDATAPKRAATKPVTAAKPTSPHTGQTQGG
jgi:hypothetical protein